MGKRPLSLWTGIAPIYPVRQCFHTQERNGQPHTGSIVKGIRYGRIAFIIYAHAPEHQTEKKKYTEQMIVVQISTALLTNMLRMNEIKKKKNGIKSFSGQAYLFRTLNAAASQ